jgi:hypothetical protein
MAEGDGAVPDYISKMVRLLEAKAQAAGVTRAEYLEGLCRAKYPPIYPREVDEYAEPAADEAA